MHADLSIRSRSREFGTMFYCFTAHCTALQLTPAAFPCGGLKHASSLSLFGLGVVRGLAHRPLFLMDEASSVFEDQLFGMPVDTDPTYPSLDASPERWDHPADPPGARLAPPSSRPHLVNGPNATWVCVLHSAPIYAGCGTVPDCVDTQQ